jgi:membrane-associated phospholipid phosphatase
LRRNLALQDYAVIGLAGFLAAMAWLRAQGPDAQLVRTETLTLLGVASLMLIVTRGGLIATGALRAMTYRGGMLGVMLVSYLVLRLLLPALHPALLDAKLVAIDETLFGKTPSAWLDPFVTPSSVEWFAFFYYSHYWLLASYLIGTLLFDVGRRRYELLLGLALVAAVGHAVYVFVPGVGPYACANLSFSHALTGGVWWRRVQTAVASAGAGLDIFPSMHTGFSVLLALHAFRYRREPPFNWSWLPTCFCVANIVIATVFLRWHYGVDLIAGALLALGGYRLAIYSWRREGSRVACGDGQAAWEAVLPIGMDLDDRRWLIGIFVIQVMALAALAFS